MAITKEQVFQAADELVAEGKSPTLAKVRERLGGGSYSDISKAMQVWRARRQAASLREPVPSVIADRLEILAGELWEAALALAGAKWKAEKELLEKTKRQAEQARQEAEDLADQLARELDQAHDELKKQSEALKAALYRAEVAEASAATLKEQVEQLNLKCQQAEAHALKAVEEAAELRGRLASIKNLS